MLRPWTLLLGLVVAAPTLADQRVALVIGNDAYSSVPVLQKAAADARTMAASLSKLGFAVDSGVNISRTETNRKLQDFLNRIEPGDVALFYFAGHGVEIAGANYLLPIDIPEATPGTPEPNSVFTRTFVPLLAQGALNLPELARETRRRVHDLAASSGHSQTPAYYDEVLGDFSFGLGSGPEAVAPSPKTQDVPSSPPGQPEEKLARLPDAVPPEAPRPRAQRENCSRSGNATFCVSSALPPAHGNSYGARNLLDGNDNTAWVEGSSGQGAGDFVVIEFDAPRSVRGVIVQNGYAKNADIFGKNSRVKDVELNFSTGDSMQATLTDQTGEQRINLNRPVKAKWVQLIIRSVYPGWKYSDTAVNELRVDAE